MITGLKHYSVHMQLEKINKYAKQQLLSYSSFKIGITKFMLAVARLQLDKLIG